MEPFNGAVKPPVELPGIFAAKFSFIIILLFYKKYLIDIFLLIEIYLPIVSILAVDRISSIIHCNSIYVKYSIFYVNIKFSIS